MKEQKKPTIHNKRKSEKTAQRIVTDYKEKVPSCTNTNLASWNAQFKKAIKVNNRPEGDLWEGIPNKFDGEEWWYRNNLKCTA